MATSSIAVPPVEAGKAPLNIFGLIPGILLLAAVGYAGKFLEKYLNTTAKAHHWTLSQHRIRAVGDRDRPHNFQFADRPENLSAGHRHL